MQRFRTRAIIAAACAAALLASPLAISPASAVVPPDSGCAPPAGITSAQISWYPGAPAGQSGLEVGCVIRNDTGQNDSSASFTIHDVEQATWHNGAAKPVTNSVAIPNSPTTTITITPVTGLPTSPTQLNRMITGPCMAPRTFIKSVTGAGVATLNIPTVDCNPSVGGFQGQAIGAGFKIENAIARSVTDATSSGADLLNSPAQANFSGPFGACPGSPDCGLSVSGTGVPNNTTIIAVNSATQVQLSNPWPGGGLLNPTVSFGGTLLVSTVRQVTGVTTTSTSRFNSAGGIGSWVSSDIGLPVTGVCTNLTATTADDFTIPAGVTVSATPSQQNLDVTPAVLVAGQTGCRIVVGTANGNAPADGDVVATQGVQLDLNPSLVPGSGACSEDQPEGFSTVAKWYNPGNFQGGGATNDQPGPTPAAPATPGTKAIGQLFFDTSVADFSAFIVERKVFTAGDPNGFVHYDVVFPFVPTGLALCPSTATSPGLGFLLDIEAVTTSQSTAATGTGRPGTGQVRNIQAQSSGGYTATVFVDSQGANPWGPVGNFSRLCVYPTGFPNPVNFQCGAG